MQVNVHDAKSQLSALIAKAEEGEEVVIARANKPVVRLVPVAPAAVERRLGGAEGVVTLADDFDELPEEFMEHFR